MEITLFSCVKVIHLASLFLWVGTLFVIQVLFFRHKAWSSDPLFHILKKLHLKVDLPLMLTALVTGGILLFINGVDFKAGWFHAKMTGALLLVVSDLWTYKRVSTNKNFSIYPFLLYLLSLLLVLSSIYMMRKKEEEWFKKYIIGGVEMVAPLLLP